MKRISILLSTVCICDIVSTQRDVRLPPTMLTTPQRSITYRKFQNITLECRAEGSPAVGYKWKKNGLEFDKNLPDIYKESEDGTIIIINNATETDEGYYQCFATNKYGTAFSDTMDVRMAFLEPSGPETTFQQTVVNGMPFSIPANPRRGFPAFPVEWIKSVVNFPDSKLLTPTDRMQIANNGDLHFAYALSEDANGVKAYISFTQNSFLNLRGIGRITNLTVTENPEGNISEFAPTLAFSSANQALVVVGGNVTLRCFFYGYPVPTIRWWGPRRVVDSGRLLWTGINDQTIHSLIESDDGTYTCIGSNPKGNITHNLQLRVGVVPVFRNKKDGPLDVNVTEGESVTFSCKAASTPEAHIRWFQNAQDLHTYNPPKRFVFSNNNKSLTIRNVCRDCVDRDTKTDLMVIQCNASNVHGYAFAQGYVNVLFNTKVTISGPKSVTVNFLEEKQYKFHCDVISDPSTPATVHWYKTEPHDQFVRDELPYVFVKMMTLVISIDKNCSANCLKYLGEYKCVGYNEHSRDSQTITLTYQPPPPEADTRGEELWSAWKIIVVAGAICMALLLFGTTCLFLRLKQIPDVDKRMNNRRLPNLPSIYDDVGYESIGFPLNELSGNNDSCEETPDGCNKYESIDDLAREANENARPMLCEGMLGEDIGCSTPLDGKEFEGKIGQQKVHGCKAITAEPDIFPPKNEESVAMNTYTDLIREKVVDNTAVEGANWNPKELDSQIAPISGEANNCLGQDQNDGNPYLGLVSEIGYPYLGLVLEEMTEYMYMDLGLNRANQCVGMGSKERYQEINEGPEEMNPGAISTEVNPDLEIGTREDEL